MATSNTKIVKESFSGSWAMSYTCPVTSKQNEKHYIYVCAPVWYVSVTCNYWAFGGSGIVQFQPAYYNGSTWVEYERKETSGADGKTTHYYGHNRDEGNLRVSYHNDYPLWRLAYWPSRGNDRWSVQAYAGGWGVCNLPEWYQHAQGHKIYSRGRTGQNTMMHATANIEDVQNTVFNYTKRTGSYIMGSDDSELIYIPYLEG